MKAIITIELEQDRKSVQHIIDRLQTAFEAATEDLNPLRGNAAATFTISSTLEPVINVDTKCMALIRDGRIVEAIKYRREVTGEGLAESKRHIDKLRGWPTS